MKRVPIVIVLLLGFLCPHLSGCHDNDLEPGAIRSCGGNIFPDNSLEVWVAAGLHGVRARSEEKRFEPVIEGVEVRVNGKKTDLTTKTSRCYGKRFQMTVPFEPVADPLSKWRPGKVVVVPKE